MVTEFIIGILVIGQFSIIRILQRCHYWTTLFYCCVNKILTKADLSKQVGNFHFSILIMYSEVWKLPISYSKCVTRAAHLTQHAPYHYSHRTKFFSISCGILPSILNFIAPTYTDLLLEISSNFY